MRLPMMDPRDLLAAGPRVLRLLDEVEALLARIEATRQDAAEQVARIDRTRREVDSVVARVRSMADETEPMFRTMASVAPDVHQILAALESLSEALSHVPGLGRLKD
jgi:hypothetical protein